MGRPRSRSRAGWPDNLYPSKGGFKYRRPDTKRDSWMGMDQAKAFAAARKLNALLMPGGDLVAKVVKSLESMADAVNLFRTDEIPSRGWGAKTAAWYEVYIAKIEAGLGTRPVHQLTVNELATWIRATTKSARSRQTYRLLLDWILACAVQEGWIEENPAAQLRKFHHTRVRERLTLEAYNAIHAAAPQWLRNAMDLSLLTLQRREDIAALRFDDDHDDALWVIPEKTENSSQLRLKIAITPELRAVIARCRDNVVSPFLVHRLPIKPFPRQQRAAARTHHTQVLPDQITRTFAEIRDACEIGGDHPPTFHEIRSLGGALLVQNHGWTKVQVQALMGHASETMTAVYLDGHELPWTEVVPGLSLPTP